MKHTPDELRQRLKSQDSQDRLVALVLIGKMRLYDALTDVTRLVLRDEESEVRAMAAWTLDVFGSPETVPVLVGAMYDDVFAVRSNAGWGLVHMARRVIHELVVPDVIDVLCDQRHTEARIMAHQVLDRIGGPAARQAISLYWDD